jgi:hypothetical protein
MTDYSKPVRDDGKRLTDTHPTTLRSTDEIRMLRDQILVRPIDAIESQHIIAAWNGAPTRGVIVAVGPGVNPNIHTRGTRDGREYRTIRESKQFRPTEVKPGQVVELGGREIGGYLFMQILIDNVLHLICREADVCFIDERAEGERRTA